MNLSTVEAFKNLKLDPDKYVVLEGDLLRRYQQVLLGISKDITDFCEKEHILYSLSGGSALGAVRHGGFIPWDDDMDINILGAQKEKFLRKFQKQHGDRYWVHSYHKEDYGLEVARVRLKGTVSRTREDIGNDECGIYVDIFFVENVPDQPLLRRIHGTMCLAAGFLLSCRNFYKNKDLMRQLEKDNENLRPVFELKIFIGSLMKFLSVKECAVITNRVYSMCRNNRSKYVSIPGGRKHYFGEMYTRDGMVRTVRKDFEGHRWRVPKDYDSYFKALYGPDYMIPSPPDKREKHVLLELKLPEEA